MRPSGFDYVKQVRYATSWHKLHICRKRFSMKLLMIGDATEQLHFSKKQFRNFSTATHNSKQQQHAPSNSGVRSKMQVLMYFGGEHPIWTTNLTSWIFLIGIRKGMGKHIESFQNGG
jgi:hypothetical protein